MSEVSTRDSRFDRSALECPAVELAPALLGCVLVRTLDDGARLVGRIVETEAYAGPHDQAAHTRNGHRSTRNEVMWGRAGLCYVYFTYGMHHCMNVVCGGVDVPEAVLVRALEPLEGLESIRVNRVGTKPRKHPLRDRDLCSGPARLCQAFRIDRSLNGADLLHPGPLVLEPARERVLPDRIVNTTRIGIDSAGPEWAGKRWRWYDSGSAHTSRR